MQTNSKIFLVVFLLGLFFDARSARGFLGQGSMVSLGQFFAVGGRVDFLDSSQSVSLLNNGLDMITILNNGNFLFPNTLRSGANYNVTISAMPTGQVCHVKNGSGIIGQSDVSNVSVRCTLSAISQSNADFSSSSSTYVNVTPIAPINLNLSSAADVLFTAVVPHSTCPTSVYLRIKMGINVDGAIVSEGFAGALTWGQAGNISVIRVMNLSAGNHTISMQATAPNSAGSTFTLSGQAASPMLLTATVLSSLSTYQNFAENTSSTGSVGQINGTTFVPYGISNLSLTPTVTTNYLYYLMIPGAHDLGNQTGSDFLIQRTDSVPSTATVGEYGELVYDYVSGGVPNAATIMVSDTLNAGSYQIGTVGKSWAASKPVSVLANTARLGAISFSSAARMFKNSRSGSTIGTNSTSLTKIADLNSIALDLSSSGSRKVLVSLTSGMLQPQGNGNTGCISIRVNGASAAVGCYQSQNSNRNRSVNISTILSLNSATHTIEGAWSSSYGASGATYLGSGLTTLTALVLE